MNTLPAYLSQDRRRALVAGTVLPDRAFGSVLFADISGFTVLTESLRAGWGPRRGSEELTKHLDAVYSSLITEVEAEGGSVIGFAGDAVTCWFDDTDGPSPPRALACGLSTQAAMAAFRSIPMPDASTTELGLKVAVTTGPVRRLVVGDPATNLLDTVAGATVARSSTGEHLAQKGEVLADEATVAGLASPPRVREWRTDDGTAERFAVLEIVAQARHPRIAPVEPVDSDELFRPWILPQVYEREVSGQQNFLTEFRPCAVVFVRFLGIDYDADDAQQHFDDLVRPAQAIAVELGGTLLQLTVGDKGSYAYIVVGALSAWEDSARRAVKIALRVRAVAGTLDHVAPLQIGITLGIMRVGSYGGPSRRTYSALGDDVNLAARLMEAADPGQILVTSMMKKAVSDHFVFETHPPILVKGKSQPLSLFSVTMERLHRPIRLQEPVFALPMVGRQRELAVLADCLEKAKQGRAQVVGIVAEAGMGKSRLVAEVVKQARNRGFAGFGGGGQSDAVNAPYLAWKSVWSAIFDLDPSAPWQKQVQSLEQQVAALVPHRAEAVPLLGTLLSLPLPENAFTLALEPKFRQSTLRALLEDLLRAVSHEEPVVIILEDLHWIDALSHDLLFDLATALASCPVCFVLAYRPPELSRLAAPKIETLSHFTKVELVALDEGEAEGAINAKVAQLYPARPGVVPRVLVDKLVARAQGNPFYLEELLNYVHDRGLDPRDAFVLDKLELPHSLQSLILSRIDQLSEGAKATLRVASIIGRLFRTQWLTGYYPELGLREAHSAAFEQLARLDLTILEAPEPEETYLFKHIVTHEVTYESLPFATRARLHGLLASFLESQIAQGALAEVYLLDLLVYHWGKTDDLTKQRDYLKKAVQSALSLSAFVTAQEYLTRLFELTSEDDITRSALALQLAETNYHQSNFPEAKAWARRAMDCAPGSAERANAMAYLGMVDSSNGNQAEAQPVLAAALPLARESGDRETLCQTLYSVGLLHWRLGERTKVAEVLGESLALARELGNVKREIFALNLLGADEVNYDLVTAEAHLNEAYRLAQASGNRERAMVALANLAVVDSERKDYKAAGEKNKAALPLAREIGALSMTAVILINIADSQIYQRDFPGARASLQEGLTLALRLGALPPALRAVGNFAELALAEEKTDRGLEIFGLAMKHPAWNADHQHGADNAIALWNLAPEVVKAGLARGAARDWDETLRELLQPY